MLFCENRKECSLNSIGKDTTHTQNCSLPLSLIFFFMQRTCAFVPPEPASDADSYSDSGTDTDAFENMSMADFDPKADVGYCQCIVGSMTDGSDNRWKDAVGMPPFNAAGMSCELVVHALFLDSAYLQLKCQDGRTYKEVLMEAVVLSLSREDVAEAAHRGVLMEDEDDEACALMRVLLMHGEGVALCGHCIARRKSRLCVKLFLVAALVHAVFFFGFFLVR